MTSARLTRQQVVDEVCKNLDRIRALGVEDLALFGSIGRNEARIDSDVDFLVRFAPGAKTFDRLLDLGDLLEQALERRVELVTAESLSPFLAQRILSEAKSVLRAA
jgi:hypothetical protein